MARKKGKDKKQETIQKGFYRRRWRGLLYRGRFSHRVRALGMLFLSSPSPSPSPSAMAQDSQMDGTCFGSTLMSSSVNVTAASPPPERFALPPDIRARFEGGESPAPPVIVRPDIVGWDGL